MDQLLKDRSSVWLFALGVVAVTTGVLLHLPMFWMGRDMGFRMAGMPMDPGMIAGMYMILGGVALSAWGLLPKRVAEQVAASRHISVAAPEDAPLQRAHWQLMAVLVVALIIDIMKPASLGFIMPGMTAEYGVDRSVAALVPFAALAGTVTGSIFWGIMADIYGRKATIMLSAVMFVGTSICGAMPSLTWNIIMCFLMGMSAGGMLPVTYALLAEVMPSKHRGWALVLVGGLGSAGGYVAASGFSSWLEPIFSWRILWLLNLPTGLILLAMGRLIPESAKFLLARGRRAEAQKAMARFGTTSHTHGVEEEDVDFAPLHLDPEHGAERPKGGIWMRGFRGKSAALTTLALGWGLVNFGLLLWLPAALVERGLPMAAASKLIAQSALVAFPTVFVVAFFYSRWSTKGSLLAATAITGIGLVGVLAMDTVGLALPPVAILAFLIIGTNAMLAILLPYTAESYPLHIRGRATGWIAACTKGGGLAAQGLSIAALTPPLGLAAAMIAGPVVVGLALGLLYCAETRGIDLRTVDRG
ncbi:MAG TPA: MFS transporter, partial [Sphingomonadaceae bacterium]|nr:MFS transporter [Sphingomonadaceae bacterium]